MPNIRNAAKNDEAMTEKSTGFLVTGLLLSAFTDTPSRAASHNSIIAKRAQYLHASNIFDISFQSNPSEPETKDASMTGCVRMTNMAP